MTDDVFGGDVGHRLRRAAARVRAAGLDAQARDWLAERPDRVGFARLAQADYEITTAAAGYGGPLPRDWIVQLGGFAATIAATLGTLLVSGRPAALPVLVLAIAVGPFAGQAVISATARARRRRARRSVSGPAPIDDPYFYADLTRRLEACAAAARADPSESNPAAAAAIGRALDWLRGAQGSTE